MILKKEDRELLLRWLLRRPSGTYAPKFSEILEKDKSGEYPMKADFIRALDKDSASMLLFLQFVREEERFVWGLHIGLLLDGDVLAIKLIAPEREWFELCVTMALCVSTY